MCHLAMHLEAIGYKKDGKTVLYEKGHPDRWSWEVGVDLNKDGCAKVWHNMCTVCGLYSLFCCCTAIHIQTEKPYWHIIAG